MQIELYLGKKVDGTEKGKPKVRFPGESFNSSFMLDNPVRQVHGHPFVPQEIKAFMSGIGLEQIPEVPSNTHCGCNENRWAF